MDSWEVGKGQRGFGPLMTGVKGPSWSPNPFRVLFLDIFGAQGRAQLVSKLQVHPPLGLQRWKAELTAALKRLSRFLAGRGRAELVPGPSSYSRARSVGMCSSDGLGGRQRASCCRPHSAETQRQWGDWECSSSPSTRTAVFDICPSLLAAQTVDLRL